MYLIFSRGNINARVRELSLSNFSNSIVDDVKVRIISSGECFSRFHSHSIPEYVDGNRVFTRTDEIKLNLAGLHLLYGFVTPLFGGFKDNRDYVDSSFSQAINLIHSRKNVSLASSVAILRLEKPHLYSKIIRLEREEGADFVRISASLHNRYIQCFSSFEESLDFPGVAVCRFVIGHELGHYVRGRYPKIRKQIEQEIFRISGLDVHSDPELFCDIVGIMHSLRAAQALREKIKPTIFIICAINSLYDIMALSHHVGGARMTFSSKRYSFLLGYAQVVAENEQMQLDIMGMSTDLWPFFWPAAPLMADMIDDVKELADDHRWEDAVSVSTKDLFYPRSFSEG